MAEGDDDLDACVRLLRALAADPSRLAALDAETRRELVELAGRISRPERDARRALKKAFRRRDRERVRAHDLEVLERARNRAARKSAGHILPASAAAESQLALAGDEEELLARPRDCYVCKEPYRRVHAFYDSLCPSCAELNWQKRHQTARLDGRVALVTGARIKIGYHAALKLLRAGARVLATTRFPHDAAERFAREPDFESFRDRLTLFELELRDVAGVEAFSAARVATLDRLDILINNAAQTVRRPAAFYEHLRVAEARGLPPDLRPLLGAPAPAPGVALKTAFAPASLAAVDHALFPPGQLDLDGQQADLRRENSWRLTLAEVPTVELLEVHLVNAVAPFLLSSRLKPLLARDPTGEKHIINVSAMEAQFARGKKTERHPHTNMAKAALNMMTRTAAADYARDGIHMNSVDTGWITDEDPLVHVERKQRVHDFHPPLDAIDGAARVLDPLFSGLATGHHPSGLFFKDYAPTAW